MFKYLTAAPCLHEPWAPNGQSSDDRDHPRRLPLRRTGGALRGSPPLVQDHPSRDGHLAATVSQSAKSTIIDLFSAFVAAPAEEVPAPLSQRFTLAAFWSDLARLAGEPVPAVVLAAPSGRR